MGQISGEQAACVLPSFSGRAWAMGGAWAPQDGAPQPLAIPLPRGLGSYPTSSWHLCLGSPVGIHGDDAHSMDQLGLRAEAGFLGLLIYSTPQTLTICGGPLES